MDVKSLSSFAPRAALVAAATLAAAAPCAPPIHAQRRNTATTVSRPAESSKVTPAREAARRYACPMHPSVTSARPGRCPKCKMELRAVDAGGEAASATAAASDEAARAAGAGSPLRIPDVELVDQDGRRVRFYTDLVKDKVVAINFIFTTCTTVCPPLGATFARLQRELGGRDVRLISVSVDPVTDTPERLKAWGAKFKAGPSWTLVTGDKPRVDELLRALAASAARREDHTPTVLIGNDAAGQWTRAYGLTAPSRLARIIDEAAAGRLAQDTKESQ